MKLKELLDHLIFVDTRKLCEWLAIAVSDERGESDVSTIRYEIEKNFDSKIEYNDIEEKSLLADRLSIFMLNLNSEDKELSSVRIGEDFSLSASEIMYYYYLDKIMNIDFLITKNDFGSIRSFHENDSDKTIKNLASNLINLSNYKYAVTVDFKAKDLQILDIKSNESVILDSFDSSFHAQEIMEIVKLAKNQKSKLIANEL